ECCKEEWVKPTCSNFQVQHKIKPHTHQIKPHTHQTKPHTYQTKSHTHQTKPFALPINRHHFLLVNTHQRRREEKNEKVRGKKRE
ncbi:hypothetical protein, partial [Klebsiella pneumoniae]|uniref:hypothetical protein n=1 Tax=Klebsiella pneumoniae TaxID=573 RepID=UPI003B5BD5A8